MSTNLKKWNKIPIQGKNVIILTFIVLFLSYPYVFNRMISVPAEQVITIIFFLIIGMINLMVKKVKTLPLVINVIFLIQGIFWFLFFCYHSDSSYIVRIFFIITTYTILSILIKTDSLYEFISINNKIVTIQAILGSIGFCLILGGLIVSIGEYINIDNRPFKWYIITCSNMRVGNIIRPSGFFDEPGALAFWGIYALIFNFLFFKNKFIEYGLIIALITTLSMAYYIQIFLYIVFFKINRLKSILPLVCVLLILTSYIINSKNDNSLYLLTFERFENAANGETGRTELSELAYFYFLKSPLLGQGAKKIESIAYMNDNPFEIPAKDGLIGTIVMYLPLIILFIGCKNKYVRYSVIILTLGYLQRPFHINLMHYIMLYTFFTTCELKYGIKLYTFNLSLNKIRK